MLTTLVAAATDRTTLRDRWTTLVGGALRLRWHAQSPLLRAPRKTQYQQAAGSLHFRRCTIVGDLDTSELLRPLPSWCRTRPLAFKTACVLPELRYTPVLIEGLCRCLTRHYGGHCVLYYFTASSWRNSGFGRDSYNAGIQVRAVLQFDIVGRIRRYAFGCIPLSSIFIALVKW